ncbi:hypothetical protein PPM_p0151 (plasmid) [Paenibacillus polymyxa M1]|nr:hypothetical protein PPM_p0151 [Paenibacillus polymyxa M1]
MKKRFGSLFACISSSYYDSLLSNRGFIRYIRNKTQMDTWMIWYRNGEQNRLEQPAVAKTVQGTGDVVSSTIVREWME